jgi:RNA-directed DNA polymerase
MQREEPPVMETGLERIAVKARSEPKLFFTSLAHHITRERVWENLCQIPSKSAAGVDGQTVMEAKESFEEWIADTLQSVHRQGYRAPEIRRVYIPKPGKREMRPLGVPTVADRALQRSVSQVLSAIYDKIFYHARSADGPAEAPTKRWQPCTRGLRAERSSGCWRRTSRTSSGA